MQDAISECRGLNEIIPVLQRAGNSDAIIEKLVALIRNACVNHRKFIAHYHFDIFY